MGYEVPGGPCPIWRHRSLCCETLQGSMECDDWIGGGRLQRSLQLQAHAATEWCINPGHVGLVVSKESRVVNETMGQLLTNA
jgi:hypothetical protein